MERMNKKKTKKEVNIEVLRWLVCAFLLITIVFLLVSRYSVTNESVIKKDAEEDVMMETNVFSSQLGKRILQAAQFAQGVASTLSGVETSGDDVRECIQAISYLPEDIYMLTVTNTFGVGITSTGEKVNLSASDYYYSKDDNHFDYTNDNQVDGQSAFVYVTPYYNNGAVAGNVCVFIDPTKVFSELPYKKYGNTGFLMMLGDGSVITTTGVENYYTSHDNFLDALDSVTLTGASASQIRLRTENLNSIVFDSIKQGERKVVSITPVYVDDWMLVTIINSSYVDIIVKGGMRNTRNLIVALFITVGVFVAIVVLLYLKNSFRNGERSKDLSNKADTDLLTECYNKIATERKIQEYIDENPDAQCMMFLFDIDNFKKINDTMGHAFGDQVLSSLGHQLKNEFRVTDIIGRLGGDEFVVFLKNIKTDEQLEREGVRITRFFHQFKVGDYVKYSATASIGAVVVPRDASSFETAYKAADKALYEAKRRGKNQLVFYSSDMRDVKSVRVSDEIES